MQKLFENWRSYLNEVDASDVSIEREAEGDGFKDFKDDGDRGDRWEKFEDGKYLQYWQLGYDNAAENWEMDRHYDEVEDPDSDSDDAEELKNIAPEMNRAFIEKIIGDFSFNSGQSSQHRWSPRQPVIDYYFDKRIGSWKYTAAIPDGTSNADNWPTLGSKPEESIGEFLTRVKEKPYQLNLPLNEKIDSGIIQKIVESVEEIIEIEVKNVYSASVLNEGQGIPIKVQLVGSYTEKLMEMINQRWTSCYDHKTLKKIGYNVDIVPIELKLDENYILLTKDLL